MSPRHAIAVAAALLCACAAQLPPDDSRPLLMNLAFEGNESISNSELESKIVTAPSGGFFKKIYRSWDADLFLIDEARILRWYRERGFFEASFGPLEVKPVGDNRVNVAIYIKEGRRTRVSQLLLEGAVGLEAQERDEILGKLPLKAGDLFDEELYEKDKVVLVAQLKEHGFAAADTTGEVQVDLDQALAIVKLTPALGPRYHFGKIFVSGNRAISTELILKAATLPEKGVFKASLLDHAQQRVYNLGVFSGARVGLEPLGDDPIAAVRIDVREAPFQTARIGLGMSVEQNRVELPRVLLEYTNRNFLGGARKLELSEGLGYAFVPSIFQPDKTGITSTSSAQITLPAILPFGIDFIGRGEFSREIQYGFNYFQTAARAALQFRWEKLTVSGSLNFVRYFGATLDLDLGQLLSTSGASAALLSNCTPSCTLTYPELRATWDQRDDLVEPHKGFFVTASLAQTLKPGSFTYLRFAPEVRGYIPLGDPVTLAVRAQWGALILEGGDSPFTQRFFAGGLSSNRGFGSLAQGPQVGAQPNAEKFATVAFPVGGNGLSLGSVELRIHTEFILHNSMIVPFLDGSRVSEQWELPFQHTPEFAPGLGLRYVTPFGPARFDLAYLANPQTVLARSPDPATVNDTPVSVSCNQGTSNNCVHESRVQWHLTLGEAF